MLFGGKCAYCGVVLPSKGWHMDHVDPVVRCSRTRNGVTTRWLDCPQNDREDNLWPCCHRCNINKSSMPVEVWRKFLMEGPVSLASYNGRFKHMLRFNIVLVNPDPFLFWFERYAAGER